MNQQTAMDELWKTRPDVIRNFVESRPLYEKLSEEVAFILETALRKATVEFAAITHRTKTIESFCEKVVRKKYVDPLREVTDFSGVRVVYLYKSDRDKVENIIEKEFNIVEKVNTIDTSDPERFGYGALHYLIGLAGASSGARYDQLRNLKCEIQVRTILQDAWAIVAHHLSYKQEADIPMQLRRKLNALSGLFETADDQFDQVRDDRLKYAARLKREIATDAREFLDGPLNLDNLVAYLSWKFPARARTKRKDVAALLDELRSLGCRTLRDVDVGISRALPAVEAMEAKYPPLDDDYRATKYAAVGVVRVAFYFLNKEHREKKIDSREFLSQYEKFDNLVAKKA